MMATCLSEKKVVGFEPYSTNKLPPFAQMDGLIGQVSNQDFTQQCITTTLGKFFATKLHYFINIESTSHVRHDVW